MFLVSSNLMVSQNLQSEIDSLKRKLASDSQNAELLLKIGSKYIELDNDSAKKYLENVKKYTNELSINAKTVYKLGVLNYIQTNYIIAKNYFDTAITLCIKCKDDTTLSRAYNYRGRLFERKGKPERFYNDILKALQIQEILKDSSDIAESHIALGDYFARKGKIDSCMICYDKAYDVLRNSADKKEIAFVLYNLGVKNEKMGNLNLAVKNYFDALKIQDEGNFNYDKINTLINIGNLYSKKKNYAKALDFYERALRLNKIVKSKAATAKINYNQGMVYAKKENYLLSLTSYKKALKLVKESNMGASIISICLNEIGLQHYNLKDYNKALEILNKAEEIGNGVSLPEFDAKRKLSLGKIYFELKNYEKSKKNTQKSIQILEKLGFPNLLVKSHMLLSRIYEATGDYKKAVKSLKNSSSLQDSLNTHRLDELLLEKDAEIKIQQQEQKNLLQKKELQILKKDKKIKNYAIVGLLLGIILLFFIAKFIYDKSLQKSKEKALIYMKEIDFLRDKIKLTLSTDIIESKVVDINSILSDPLSERELDVINELSTGKSNKEISDTLCISVNTVRTHLRKIYEKLDVNNRTQAVKKVGGLK